ncbi:MAG TPA: GNAT family protein [Gaiellaceae bacterium]|nr:GNAT family protein [Gaiellaceae bacterium]
MKIELRGERVLLRPLRADELETVWQARVDDESAPWMSTPEAYERLRERVASSGRFVDGWLDLGIESDGRLVGEIDARHPPRSMPEGVFELGISLFDVHDRGRGLGTDAIRLLTRHLFDREGARRVQASTWVENRAMRRVFEKLGFVEEGVLRAYMPSERGRDDYVLYAITRDDLARSPVSLSA